MSNALTKLLTLVLMFFRRFLKIIFQQNKWRFNMYNYAAIFLQYIIRV